MTRGASSNRQQASATGYSRHSLLALALLLLLVSSSAAAVGEAQFSRRVWQVENGLPQDTVNAVTQTADGYLWIATDGGLARFDGLDFRIFNRENSPALQDDSIYSLQESRSGALWVGTEGGGLYRFRAGVFEHFGPDEGLTNGFVRDLFEDRQGRLWVGTDRGLFRVEQDRLIRVDGRDGVPGMSVHAFYEDEQGRLWVGGSGVLVFGPDGVKQIRGNRGVAANSVRDIAAATDGAVWVATVGGVFRAPSGAPEEIYASEPLFEESSVYISPAANGEVWVGSRGQGLIRIGATGQLKSYGAPGSVPNNHVLALFEDSEQNVWVGTGGGLLRMSHSVVSTTTIGSDTAPESVRSVYEDSDGTIWIVALSGAIYQLRDGRVELTDPLGVETTIYRQVFRDSTGAFWVGTTGAGATRIVNGQQQRFTTATGLVNNNIRAFAEASDGSIWIGTDSGVSRLVGDRVENFHTADGLAYGSTRAIIEDADGLIWIATDKGVSSFDGERMSRDPRLQILDGEKVWALHADSDNGVWIGTRGAGLFLLRSDRLDRFDIERGIPSNNIHQVVEDQAGRLWVSGSAGVFSVARGDLLRAFDSAEFRPAIARYGRSEGMESSQMGGGVQPAGFVASDGGIWFPHAKGAARIAPGVQVKTILPPVLIERVQADGVDMRVRGSVEIPPGRGQLEIHYGAARMRSADRIRFRYKLEGLEDQWTDAGGRRVAYYTNVPAGDYTFHVAAYEPNAPYDVTEALLTVSLLPRFYQTAWFALLGAAVLALIGLAAYRLRMRRVHDRYAAVLSERNRLAREMHDTLIQGCVGVATLLDASVSLEQSAPERASQLVRKARVQASSSVDDARRAIWSLRHDSDTQLGLDAALQALTQRLETAAGITITYETAGDPVPVDPDTQHDLLMITREAILNAVRHANPTNIVVTTRFDAEHAQVSVTDDGCGFVLEGPAPEALDHYGIVGMKERAEQSGGAFSLHSAPKEGTTVSVSVPLQPVKAR